MCKKHNLKDFWAVFSIASTLKINKIIYCLCLLGYDFGHSIEMVIIMAIISLRQLLDYAAEHSFALPAFNVNNLEQVRAILHAADKTNSPVILQASHGARQYAGPNFLQGLVRAAVSEWPHIPICLHQDHGASPAVCLRSIQDGFSSVMMDGSLADDMKTPTSFEYNVRVTRQVVDCAHACGVSVEGELGCLGSLETGLAGEEDGSGAEGVLSDQQLLTDPDEAKIFVAETNVDALAIAIGTSHGAYKFSKPPTDQVLSLDRILAIHRKIPNTHLVMHGSSSVPSDLIAKINEYGGKIPETYGVPVAQIQEGIRHGVRKVNIDTDLRLAATAAIREYLHCHPDAFDPRKYLAAASAAMQLVCEHRYQAFGCAGHASKIKPIGLRDMVSYYALEKQEA